MSAYKLRSEAGILGDGNDDLTHEQEQAGDQVFQLITEMLGSDEKADTPKPIFLPRIDRKRSNRVLLIDGGRGSGKTALLLTLLAQWRRSFLDTPPEEPEVKPDGTKAPLRWRHDSKRIVPVGLLDLHPLPPSTNLLFHAIGRFERVVEWLEGDGKKEQEPAAWQLSGSGELESRKKWQGLLRAAAAGWDGNVKERAGRLDLEAYAAELEETERQRLNVVDTFADFIDTLVKDFSKRLGLGDKHRPLFVLAVDDADMDPSRSVELLDTVRMLWHPRVTFLLTGNSELFVHTLAEYVLGDLRRPLQGHNLLQPELDGIADQRPVMELTSDIYDKIIPPGHRCKLPPIPPGRRLEVTLWLDVTP